MALLLASKHEQHVSPHMVATVLFLIMTFLALVTVMFEKGKEFLMEVVADRTTKPVVAGLFSELTVLGFLSLVTFVISQMDILDRLSGSIFGEGEEREGYLEELLEQIHFIIFAVMVIFIMQSMILLRNTRHQLSDWHKMQTLCSSDNPNKAKDIADVIDWLAQEEIGAEYSCCGWRQIVNAVFGRSARHKEMIEVLRFDAMREEFLITRSQFPPFDPMTTEKQLPGNFDYGRYMQKQLTNFLIEIIEVPVNTWVVIWILSAIFCCIMIATLDDPKTLVWVWAGFGWTMQFFHMRFQLHLNRTLSMCCNRKYMQKKELKSWFRKVPGTEMDVLVKDDRPGWTTLDLPDPHTRSVFEQCILNGQAPNRQHLLFPTQVHGKWSNEFLARLYLLCFTVYSSLLIFQFLPITKKFDDSYRMFFILVSFEPLAYYVTTLSQFIRSIVEVNSLRVFKPSTTISTVLRDQKAERAIKAIVLLNNLSVQFDDVPLDGSEEMDISAGQREEIERIFKMFDTDGGGEIDSSEFRQLMISLGVNTTEEEAAEKLKLLDEDGNGTISMDEFVKWHMANLRAAETRKDTTVKELVDRLFAMFDNKNEDEEASPGGKKGEEKGDGQISMQEFKDGLNKFSAGLSDEEVANLLQELDEDGDGSINKEEFAAMLEKYADAENF
jgi:Ca2+-binding EF-hand superfamily protein